jgi:hypothetical protein
MFHLFLGVFGSGCAGGFSVVHSGELALGTTGNLLSAELDQLGLQLLELSLELILVLAPELASLDLSGRLGEVPSAFRRDRQDV